MKFKVYNQNGKVRVTKTCADGTERPMFSDVPDGEMVEISVDATIATKSHKYVLGMAEEEPRLSLAAASRALILTMATGSPACDEMLLASDVLLAAQEGKLPENYEKKVKPIMISKHSDEPLFGRACDFLLFTKENGILDEEEYSAAVNILNRESAKFTKCHPFDPILNDLAGVRNMEAAKAAFTILSDEAKGIKGESTAMLHQYMIRYAAITSDSVPADVFGGIKARIRCMAKENCITPETAQFAIDVLDNELKVMSDMELESMLK